MSDKVKVPPPTLTPVPVARLEERPSGEPGSTPGGDHPLTLDADEPLFMPVYSKTYRYRNPERRREYIKILMRARRAK